MRPESSYFYNVKRAAVQYKKEIGWNPQLLKTLNSYEDSLSLLTQLPHPSNTLANSNLGKKHEEVMKETYHLPPDALTIALVRHFAFALLKKHGMEFKPYQHPVLGNVK